jgi:MFS family permease
MTDPTASSLHIARAIQLAVAPVFLLSGVGVTLGVLATRLGRIIDRARFLEKQSKDPEAPAQAARAIALFTACALFICLLIATLFLGALLQLELVPLLAGLFIAAMLALIVGYLHFLREIFLATRSLRFGGQRQP